MGTLRTPQTEAKYQQAIREGLTVPLAEIPSLIEWKFWKLVKNQYPHDLVLKEHDLLIPLRVFALPGEMTMNEIRELFEILEELSNQYDSIKFNYPVQQSVRNHFHLHLQVNK